MSWAFGERGGAERVVGVQAGRTGWGAGWAWWQGHQAGGGAAQPRDAPSVPGARGGVTPPVRKRCGAGAAQRSHEAGDVPSVSGA